MNRFSLNKTQESACCANRNSKWMLFREAEPHRPVPGPDQLHHQRGQNTLIPVRRMCKPKGCPKSIPLCRSTQISHRLIVHPCICHPTAMRGFPNLVVRKRGSERMKENIILELVHATDFQIAEQFNPPPSCGQNPVSVKRKAVLQVACLSDL